MGNQQPDKYGRIHKDVSAETIGEALEQTGRDAQKGIEAVGQGLTDFGKGVTDLFNSGVETVTGVGEDAINAVNEGAHAVGEQFSNAAEQADKNMKAYQERARESQGDRYVRPAELS